MAQNKPFFFFFFLSFLIPLLVKAQSPKLLKTINTEGAQIEVLVYSGNKKHLLTGDLKGNLCLIDAKTFSIEKKIKAHKTGINSITFNKAGDLMLTATRSGEIKLWDFESLTVIKTFQDARHGRITFCVFNPDESFIYFDLGERLCKMKANFKDEPEILFWHNHFSTCGQVSPDNRYVVYGNGLSIYFIDVNTDKRVRELGYCSGPVNELAFLNNNDFVTWCQDGTINFWNKNKQGLIFVEPIRSFHSGDFGGYSKLQFSPSGKWILAGGAGNNARVWDSKTNKKTMELRGHTDTIRAVLFGSSDSIAITASYDHTVKIWRLIPEPELPKEKPESPVLTEEIKKPEPVQEKIPEKEKDPIVAFQPDLNGRNVEIRHNFKIEKKQVEIEIWDDENEDGDIVNIYLNGVKIAENFTATKIKKVIPVTFYETQENFIVLEAVNLGKTPPNTVALGFQSEKGYQKIKLQSDLKNSVALKFIVD